MKIKKKLIIARQMLVSQKVSQFIKSHDCETDWIENQFFFSLRWTDDWQYPEFIETWFKWTMFTAHCPSTHAPQITRWVFMNYSILMIRYKCLIFEISVKLFRRTSISEMARCFPFQCSFIFLHHVVYPIQRPTDLNHGILNGYFRKNCSRKFDLALNEIRCAHWYVN